MRHTSLRWLGVAVLVVGLLSSCGDGGAGPSATPIDVEGAWNWSMTNVSGGGLSCSVLNGNLSLNQSNNAFTGTYDGNLRCVASGQTVIDVQTSGAVVNGVVQGSGVRFDLDTQDFHLTGTVSGNSMSGTVTLRFDTGSSVVTMSGNWLASR